MGTTSSVTAPAGHGPLGDSGGDLGCRLGGCLRPLTSVADAAAVAPGAHKTNSARTPAANPRLGATPLGKWRHRQTRKACSSKVTLTQPCSERGGLEVSGLGPENSDSALRLLAAPDAPNDGSDRKDHCDGGDDRVENNLAPVGRAAVGIARDDSWVRRVGFATGL